MNSSTDRQQIDKYSSIARYSIAILSALIVLFPSSNTFIKPPHTFDFLLPIAFFTGIIAFFCHSYVILLRDTSKKKKYTDFMVSASTWGLILTFFALFIISIYIFVNTVGDRISKPTISSLKIDPLNPQVNSLVQFSGEARDESSDNLTWTWEVVQFENKSIEEELCPNKKSNGERLRSNLKIAHWIPKISGKYKLLVQVSGKQRKSLCQQIVLNINKTNDSESKITNLENRITNLENKISNL